MPTISFKVSPEEARTLRRRVRSERTTLSEYLRKVALPVEKPRRRVLKRNPDSGLIVDVTPGPVVTMEEIKAALADYP